MTDPLVQLLLENIQPRSGREAWHGGPTPVTALRGVSVEEASWHPAPGRKSIWQLTLHIAYWKSTARRRLSSGLGDGEMPFPRTPANWPRVLTAADGALWRADVALLKAEHARLLAIVATVPISRYGATLAGGKRWTVGETILGIAQHDAYHAGQILLLKRWWSALQPTRRRTRRRTAT